MIIISKLFCRTISLICLAPLVLACSSLYAEQSEDFKVFDSTLYKNKPDLRAHGIQFLKTLYAGSIWGKSHPLQEPPPKKRVKEFLAQKKDLTELIVLDVEQWDLKGSDFQTSRNLGKIAQTINIFRELEPRRQFGIYGIVPVRDYHCPQKKTFHRCWEKWRNQNARLIPIINDVDAIFPSLYTFYTDQQGWRKYAIAQIAAAREIAPDKKVYVFLWPQFHQSNKLRGYEYLGDEYWQLQLDTAFDYADGVVIWGGWDFKNGRQADWGDGPAWWRVSQQWINRKLLSGARSKQLH